MYLKGGLGNMLFQIAAGISFSIKSNTDLSLINLYSHFEYLNADQTYQPKLKHSFEYLKLNQFKNFRDKPTPIEPLKLITFPFEYVDYLPPCDHIIEGFFQSEKYFINQRQNILSYFRPSDEIKKILKKYDFANFKTTSIHVRRGDYLNNPDYHTVQSKEYYYEAIEITKNKTDKYLIFSDDLEWCKNNFKGEEFIFIENEKDYVEIYLMSLCNNNIISNSSFSWWGAWMNENDQKIIIGPKKWFGPKDKTLTDKDIIPEKWLKI
jgi:hypothetical protein